MNNTDSDSQEITHEQISARARKIWQENGGRSGHDMEHWFQAEAELRQEREQTKRQTEGTAQAEVALPGGSVDKRKSNKRKVAPAAAR